MPYVSLQTSGGRVISIESSDPKLIAMWLIEQLPRLGWTPAEYNRICVQPLWISATEKDWPPVTRIWGMNDDIHHDPNASDLDRAKWIIAQMSEYLEQYSTLTPFESSRILET